MKEFADLFLKLDSTTKTNAKVAALEEYFQNADPTDKMWAIALLSHKRPRRTVKTRQLSEWAAEESGIPLWLFEESYHVVGDLAETISLVLPAPAGVSNRSLSQWILGLKSLRDQEDKEKKSLILQAWGTMDRTERLVFNKLITGGFRVGVSQKLMVRALSKSTGLEENVLAHRLMGNWDPEHTRFESLVDPDTSAADDSKPYPFYLAYPVDGEPEELGEPEPWIAERKWDGIRGQLIIRNRQVFTWSRGEELVTDKFPEYQRLPDYIPDGTVLDGEILAYKDAQPLPFGTLQTRIGRKNVSKAILSKAPVILMGYDLLEWEGRDIRSLPFFERRKLLEDLALTIPENYPFRISPVIEFREWDSLRKEREQSRKHLSEGIMLKHRESPYETGRKKGNWWKWKIDPLTVDAVMIYAMRGHGRRANLYTDYTFAVWDGDQLVPFTKAYSGLTDKEILEVDAFVKRNTIDRFGPVRNVRPELVFEIAFEGINRSTRHKSGVALRFPRMHRWRRDKPPQEANTLDDLKALLDLYGDS